MDNPSSAPISDPHPDQAELPLKSQRFVHVIEQSAEVRVESIDVSDNPRKWFDENALIHLAASMLTMGQMQNIVVRDIGGTGATHYQLIGGERRLRAAKSVGMPTLIARVVQCDDVTAIEMRGEENYRREQFNAIEEGHWFRQMLDSGEWTTQAELAAHLKVDPSTISHRLSLLELPSDWLDHVAFGRVSATAAAILVPFNRDSAIVKSVEERLVSFGKKPTVEKFSEWVCQAVRDHSRVMSDTWEGPKFEPLLHLESLDIRLASTWPGTKPVERAFNVAMWEELQEAANDALRKEQEDNTNDADGEAVSPDEQSDVSHLTDGRLRSEFIHHYQTLIVERLKPDALAIRLWLCAVVDSSDYCGEERQLVSWLAARVSDVTDDVTALIDTWSHTEHITPKNIAAEAVEMLLALLTGEDHFIFDLEFLIGIMPEFCDDPLGNWRPSSELLAHCSTRQRAALAAEIRERTGKAGGDDELCADKWPKGFLPDLLLPGEVIESLEEGRVTYMSAGEGTSNGVPR